MGILKKMKCTQESIYNGWQQYTLENDQGMVVQFLDYGGIITSIQVPDRDGKLENVVLGFEQVSDYSHNTNYLGALVGPVAGRIAQAVFEMNGQTYPLEKNEANHHLHGGSNGLHQVIWQAAPFETAQTVGVRLTHRHPAGLDGHPGNLDVAVTYTLDQNNAFSITYEAVSDQDTVVALTNHSYFNLSGNLQDTVHQHQVTINSEKFIELDADLIPTGQVLPVAGTPFDFQQGRYLADGIAAAHEQNVTVGNGYDHYFLFRDSAFQEQIRVMERQSGRTMTIETNQPGMVMYTANALTEGMPLAGGTSKNYLGVCFETQASPASLQLDTIPSVKLAAGERYEKKTVFSFGNL